MLSVVVDTNVFIGALFHNDVHAQRVLQLISDGRVQLLTTQGIEDEIIDTVTIHALKARTSWKQAKSPLLKLYGLLGKAKHIPAPQAFTGCPDSDDDKFFDCAMAGGAAYIIAGNHHLSGVAQPPVPVLSPWQFLREERGTAQA